MNESICALSTIDFRQNFARTCFRLHLPSGFMCVLCGVIEDDDHQSSHIHISNVNLYRIQYARLKLHAARKRMADISDSMIIIRCNHIRTLQRTPFWDSAPIKVVRCALDYISQGSACALLKHMWSLHVQTFQDSVLAFISVIADRYTGCGFTVTSLVRPYLVSMWKYENPL